MFGILLQLMVMVACINIDLNSTLRQNDSRAQLHVRQINEAEAKFFAKHNRFGRLSELGPHGAALVEGNLAQGVSDGYRFDVHIQAANYQVLARPVEFLTTGWRSYYSDESQNIRQNISNAPATATSPELSLSGSQEKRESANP